MAEDRALLLLVDLLPLASRSPSAAAVALQPFAKIRILCGTQ
jgi:hypothetical protein